MCVGGGGSVATGSSLFVPIGTTQAAASCLSCFFSSSWSPSLGAHMALNASVDGGGRRGASEKRRMRVDHYFLFFHLGGLCHFFPLSCSIKTV